MNSPPVTVARHGPTLASLRSLVLIVAVVLGGTQAVSWWQDTRDAAQIKAHLAGQRITLYTTATCIYCAKAKDWLSEHGIPWDECDVEADTACQQTFEAHGAPGTPMVRVNGHWQLGFDAGWVAQALQMPPGRQTSVRPSADTSPRP